LEVSMGEPKFIQTPVNSGGRATVANTAVDGSGTLVTIATGTAGGLRIDRIHFRANATTAANKLRIYLTDGAGTRCIHEILVTAVTLSNTAVGWNSEWILNPPMILQSGATLKFAPTVALTAGFDATVVSGGAL
jgi:hypothetical protein